MPPYRNLGILPTFVARYREIKPTLWCSEVERKSNGAYLGHIVAE